jgi:hypothetical protein
LAVLLGFKAEFLLFNLLFAWGGYVYLQKFSCLNNMLEIDLVLNSTPSLSPVSPMFSLLRISSCGQQGEIADP